MMIRALRSMDFEKFHLLTSADVQRFHARSRFKRESIRVRKRGDIQRALPLRF